MKPKILAFTAVLILASGMVAAAVIYQSQLFSGTGAVHPGPAPSFGMSFSGLPSDLTVNQSSSILDFDVVSTVPGNLSVNIFLNISASGITPSSVTLLQYFGSWHDTDTFEVNATQAAPGEISFDIIPPWVMGGGEGFVYFTITFHFVGSYSWTAQAFGTPVP